MRKNLLAYMLFLFMLVYNNAGYALEVETHEAMNEYIASTILNGFSLSDYLNKNLGFTKGKEEEINGKKVYKWLRDGGYYEDKPAWTIPYLRSVNHFHNPLLTWESAGLNDTVLGINYTGQSSILWSQNSNQDLGGKWSWYDARDYFYKGLTLTSKVERDSAMANTFRALGQLMHLIEDASVPAHVRKDIHLEGLYV